jgi:ABC-type dipeptide/oligopeptide/nickel transport system permease subunit
VIGTVAGAFPCPATTTLVAPWIANLAEFSIALLALGVNILGNGLREEFDTKKISQV